jgi:hypothetical protein
VAISGIFLLGSNGHAYNPTNWFDMTTAAGSFPGGAPVDIGGPAMGILGSNGHVYNPTNWFDMTTAAGAFPGGTPVAISGIFLLGSNGHAYNPTNWFDMTTAAGLFPGATEVRTHTASAVLRVVALPWIKTTSGDVGSIGQIGPIQRDISGIPEFNADYLVISGGTIAPNFRSVKSWLVGGYSSLTIYPQPNPTMYDALWKKFGNGATERTTDNDIDFPNPGGVFWYDGDFALTGCHGPGSFNFSGSAVFFVNGDLTLNKNIGDPGAGARCNYNGGRIVFVVKGNLTGVNGISVDKDVSVLNGYFITNGNFQDGTKTPAQDDEQLTINGGLVAGLNPGTTINFQRNLGASNAGTPAELINFDPAYLWLFRDLLGDPKVVYREVAP